MVRPGEFIREYGICSLFWGILLYMYLPGQPGWGLLVLALLPPLPLVILSASGWIRASRHSLRIIMILTVLLATLYVFCGREALVAELYDGDTLAYPAMWNCFAHGETLRRWVFAVPTFLFPDLSLYFLISAIVPGFRLAMILFVAAQVLLVLGGFALLETALLPESKNRPLMFIVFLALLAYLTHASAWSGLALLFTATHHVGVIISLFFTTWILVRMMDLQCERRFLLALGIALFLVTLLTTLSDGLFLPQCVAPAVAALAMARLFGSIGTRKLLSLMATLAVGAVGGAMIYDRLFRRPELDLYSIYFRLNPFNVPRQLEKTLPLLTRQLLQNKLLAVLLLLSIAACFGLLWIHIRRRSTPFQKFVSTSETAYGAGGLEGRGRPSKGGAARREGAHPGTRKDATNRSVLERHRGGAPVRYSVSEVHTDFRNAVLRLRRTPLDARIIFLSGFILFLCLSNVSVMLLSAAPDVDSLPRYTIPLVLVPLLFLSTVTQYLLQVAAVDVSRPSRLALLLVPLLLLVLTVQKFPNAVRLATYYPPWVRDLDGELAKRGLKYGLAKYRQAKYFSLFSKHGVEVVQVTSDLRPQLWVNNRDWYGRPFQFIITDETEKNGDPREYIAPEVVFSRFGPPDETFTAGTNTVRVYKGGRLTGWFSQLAVDFSQIGAEAVLPAAHLPSTVGTVAGGSRVAEGCASGYLSYGPYLQIPPGIYHARIFYEAKAATSGGTAGMWDVVFWFTGHNDGLVVKEGILSPESNCTEFDFKSDSPCYVEIRTFYTGTGALTVYNLTLQRTQ